MFSWWPVRRHLNDRDDVVETCNGSSQVGIWHQGMVRAMDIAPLHVPTADGGAGGIYGADINAQGDIVGTYESSDNTYHGFRRHNGQFTTIDEH